MRLKNRIRNMFGMPVRPPDESAESVSRRERERRTDTRMRELLSWSERSIAETKEIKERVEDIRSRIESDPFLIFGERKDP